MDISVVIGFKDWGVERLLLSIKSIINSFDDVNGEVIVSDYGSTTFGPGELQTLVEQEGAQYVRTETDGHWSRSRAINAGYTAANGSVLVATDADMLFSPHSMATIYREVIADPHTAVVLQCRDLPETYDHERISTDMPEWGELHAVSQIRPRWGMGGMFAAHRRIIGVVGGYDNRMHTYGGEDLDLAIRVQRSGSRIRWIENNDVRMYHIWHEPTIRTVEQSEAGKEAVASNRAILHEDSTFKRNENTGALERYRVTWAPKQFTVHKGSVNRDRQNDSVFTVFTPSHFTFRSDGLQILTESLTVENRAVIAQAIVIREGVYGELETFPDERVPILVIDTRLTPLIHSYFEGSSWDIYGAIATLKNSRISLAQLGGAVGVIDESEEKASPFTTSWAWKLQSEDLPPLISKEEGVEIIQNLPLDFIMSLKTTIDFSLRMELTDSLDQMKELEKAASGWRLIRPADQNLIFEAVFLNASRDLIDEIQNLPNIISCDIVPLSIDIAADKLEELRSDRALSLLVEKQRQAYGYDEAVLVAWTEALSETNYQPGCVLLRTPGKSLLVWMSGIGFRSSGTEIELANNFPDLTTGWARGIYSPAPAEAMLDRAEYVERWG